MNFPLYLLVTSRKLAWRVRTLRCRVDELDKLTFVILHKYDIFLLLCPIPMYLFVYVGMLITELFVPSMCKNWFFWGILNELK